MNNHPNRLKPVTMEIGDHVRQGDVLIRRITDVPDGAAVLKRDAHDRIVLAHGEKTGHAHAFRAAGVCAYSKLEGHEIEFLLVNGGSGAALKHELVNGKKAEHDAIKVPDGAFECAAQVEYSPAELIRVED